MASMQGAISGLGNTNLVQGAKKVGNGVTQMISPVTTPVKAAAEVGVKGTGRMIKAGGDSISTLGAGMAGQ